jgi:hypothetical protein
MNHQGTNGKGSKRRPMQVGREQFEAEEAAAAKDPGRDAREGFAHFARKAWLHPQSLQAESGSPEAWRHWSGLGLVDSGKRISGH